MAHFARIEDNIVREVIVVNNEVITDEHGQEQESLGIAFCKSLYGEDTEWLQTSYNGSFRGRYAGAGYTYDSVKDKFVNPIIEE
jgi:hypothetical protein